MDGRPDFVLTTLNDDDALPRRFVETAQSHVAELAREGRLPPYKIIGNKSAVHWHMAFTRKAPLGLGVALARSKHDGARVRVFVALPVSRVRLQHPRLAASLGGKLFRLQGPAPGEERRDSSPPASGSGSGRPRRTHPHQCRRVLRRQRGRRRGGHGSRREPDALAAYRRGRTATSVPCSARTPSPTFASTGTRHEATPGTSAAGAWRCAAPSPRCTAARARASKPSAPRCAGCRHPRRTVEGARAPAALPAHLREEGLRCQGGRMKMRAGGGGGASSRAGGSASCASSGGTSCCSPPGLALIAAAGEAWLRLTKPIMHRFESRSFVPGWGC